MRILIVKLSSIGDVVHALPAAALLRRALPEATISWVVERRAAEILKGSPAIDELIELDTSAWRKSLLASQTRAEVRAIVNDLRGRIDEGDSGGDSLADIAIDFQGLIKSAVVAKASRARFRIGFETGDLREKASRFLLNEQVPTSGHTHVIEKNIGLARAAMAHAGTGYGRDASPGSGSYEFPIAITKEDEHYIDLAVSHASEGFAILNPGGGWATKLWPAESFAQLSDWLWGECGLHSFITFGPGEERLAETVAMRSKSGAARPLKSTLKQFAALARRAAIFVGGDTGPLHIAAASRAPIVGIYGPTAPERNGPFDPADVTVGRDLWCREQCHRRRCWHWQCMDVPVRAVTRAVTDRLTRANQKSPIPDKAPGGARVAAEVYSFDV